jgi:hypothetical protein
MAFALAEGNASSGFDIVDWGKGNIGRFGHLKS